MVIVVAGTAPVLGGGAAPPVLVASGVTIAGVPVGGMSYEQAQASLAPAFAQPVRLSLGSKHWQVPSSHFGTSVAVADGLSRAFGASPGEAVDLRPEIDADAVQGYVRGLQHPVSRPAKDARLI